MPKAELHRDTIEIQSGRSSGGVGVGLRGFRLYSGRTYYKKKEIWLCDNCYLARHRHWWSPTPKRAPKPAPTPTPTPAPAPASTGESKYLAALEIEMARQSASRQTKIGTIAVFIGGAALLSIVLLAIFFQGKSTDAAKPQVATDSSVVPLEGTNKSNAPPSDIMAAQNRLIELRFLKGPADGVWGTKSRNALRAFKVANGLSADDKWDDLVSGRLYSTKAARSPLPLATTSPQQ
jgi:hypothetical protein